MASGMVSSSSFDVGMGGLWRIGSWVIAVAMADFLFYGHVPGWTVGLFCLLLLGLTVAQNPAALSRRRNWLLLALCAVLGLMLVESVNWLALALFWLFFAALFTNIPFDHPPLSWLGRLMRFGMHIVGGAALQDGWSSVQHVSGAIRRGRAFARAGDYARNTGVVTALMRAWFLPLSVFGVFLFLFAAANPVIETWIFLIDSWLVALERWISSIHFSELSSLLSPERLIFWAIAGVICWGVLRSGSLRPVEATVKPTIGGDSPFAAYFFSLGAVTRTLVLSNLLFLAHNLLDANFLLLGAALPSDITYASYAHRGAYPLIATALLAAAFVLIATREAGGLMEYRFVRTLIYLWLAQNLVLVASSIWRTQLYVAAYSLTYLRLAALLWMGLVLLGLIFVALKIRLGKSGPWLIRVNLAATLALLIATCPFDMGRFIADYNVARWIERKDQPQYFDGRYLDVGYLRGIGASALPALRRAQHQVLGSHPFYRSITDAVAALQAELTAEINDWRRWTFRAHRLAEELGSGQGGENTN
jgi:hypothetical protein